MNLNQRIINKWYLREEVSSQNVAICRRVWISVHLSTTIVLAVFSPE